MRNAVKKPSMEILHNEAVFNSHTPSRLERAKSIHKSSLITRFPSLGQSSMDNPLPVVPVKAPPSLKNHSPASTAAHHQTSNKAEKMMVAAIANAHAHEAANPHVKKPKKRLSHRIGISQRAFNAGAGALAVLLLSGFVVYQNMPNLSMRIAASRAGVHASLPQYQPAGFSMQGPVQYSPGRISVSFRSNTDNRAFTFTQQVSNWNSQALLDNFFAANNIKPITVEEKGKTIYIYNESNAAWVSGGIWYQIEGDSSLNSDQLLRIANSV